jgi:hypothetical protein
MIQPFRRADVIVATTVAVLTLVIALFLISQFGWLR